MMLDLEFSSEAKDDLRDMFSYGASHWGEEYAQNYLIKFEANLRLLCTHPKMGKANGLLHSFPIDQYLVIYEATKTRILIYSIIPRGRPLP